MTITIKIRNDDAPGGRKATVIRHDRVDDDVGGFTIESNDVATLGGGEEATVYIHAGMSVTVEERTEDKGNG